MTEIQIVEAPLALKESIKFHTFQTYEEHRARQPFAFSQNQFKLNIEPDIDASFLDTNGKPRASSDNIFAAMQETRFADIFCYPPGAKRCGRA